MTSAPPSWSIANSHGTCPTPGCGLLKDHAVDCIPGMGYPTEPQEVDICVCGEPVFDDPAGTNTGPWQGVHLGAGEWTHHACHDRTLEHHHQRGSRVDRDPMDLGYLGTAASLTSEPNSTPGSVL